MALRNRSQKIELLRTVPLFAALSTKQLTEVARHADQLEVEAGHVITREGGVGGEMFVLATGSATVTQDGRRIATIGAGQVVGEMSLLDGSPQSATVVADEPLTLLVIGARELRPLLRNVPDLGLRLLQTLARRLREAEARES